MSDTILLEFTALDGTKNVVNCTKGEIQIIEAPTDCIDDILSALTPEQLEQVKNGRLVIYSPTCSIKN